MQLNSSIRHPQRYLFQLFNSLQEEVKKLLSKVAIEPAPAETRGCGFYSHYFLVPKRDSRLRPILHLHILNKFIAYKEFQMESLPSILPFLKKGDQMAILDFQDTYFTSLSSTHTDSIQDLPSEKITSMKPSHLASFQLHKCSQIPWSL